MKVWMIGDVHGDSQKALYKFITSKEVNLAIQLGDFGFIWNDGDVKENSFLNKFEKRFPHKTLLTVLGNHENYTAIQSLPIVEIYGAKAYQIRKNVFAILRGEVLNINNTNILCIGGADSVDKEWRLQEMAKDEKHRVYWWAEERITQADIDNALKNIKGKSIDYVCSHEAPLEMVYRFFPYERYNKIDTGSSSYLLQDLYFNMSYNKTWFCGHYHISETLVTNWIKEKTFQILGIDEIKEIEI